MTTHRYEQGELGSAPLTRTEAVAPPVAVHPLIELAIREKLGVEGIERLVALKEREEDRQAKREFVEAMARFKTICPPVPRRSKNEQFSVMRNGMKVPRAYAGLEEIDATIRGPLAECGLSYRWGDSRVEDGNLTTPCIVSHVGGHSESSSVVLPVEARSGANEQQKYGSVMKYAQRYSLIQVLGLTDCEDDLDGATEEELKPITPDEVLVLEGLLQKLVKESEVRRRLLEHYAITSLDELPTRELAYVRNTLEDKVQKQRDSLKS